MSDLAEQLRHLAEAEERLDRTVAAMTDDQAGAPSLLPGWTRGHVVTHLARNAEGNARMVAAKLVGEDRAQYVGGPPARAAAIEAGAGRPAAELLADLRAATAELAEAFGRVRDDQWDLLVPAGVGPRPIRQRVRGRLVEVEVHHADLGLEYSWRDWPEDLVTYQLPRWVRAIADREPGGAPDGDWVVSTPTASWTISVAGGAIGVLEAADVEPAGSVHGADAAIYAWLIGRATAADAGIEVVGDARVADLPRWLPWS